VAVADSADRVALEELLSRADRVPARLREMNPLLEASPAVQAVAGELPAYADSIRVERTAVEEELEALSGRRRLDELRQEWLRYRTRLNGWQEMLEDEWRQLQLAVRELRGLAEAWEQTQREVDELDLPRSVADRVATILTATDSVQTRLRDRLDEVLAVETAVVEVQTTVSETLDHISSRREEARRDLWRRDSQGLLTMLFSSDHRAELGPFFNDTATTEIYTVRSFYATERFGILFQLALFVALSMALVLVRRRGEVHERPWSQTARQVFARPFSGAFLVVALTTRFVYPIRPVSVTTLLMLATILPLIRFLPALMKESNRKVLYSFAVLVALQLSTDFLADGTALQRLLLTVVDLGALIGAVWILRSESPPAEIADRAWWKLFRVYLHLGVVMLGLAVAGNLAGWSDLAFVISEGVILGAYIALVLLVAVLVLQQLIAALPYTSFGRLSRILTRHTGLVTKNLSRLIQALAVVLWLIISADVYEVRDWFGGAFLDFLAASLTIGVLDVSVGDVLAFVVTIWAAFLLSRIVRFILTEEILPRFQLERGVASAVSTLVHWLIVALGVIAAASAAGLGGSQLTVVAGALGVGIGFGLQAVVNNFISGLILIFERPMKVGDKIEVGTLLGEVRRIGMRASVIRTFDGAEVVVPNGNLTTQHLINWTLSDQRRRVEVLVGVAYGTDPQTVLRLLASTASEHPEVLKHPEPDALFKGFGESSLDFSLRFWTASFDEWIRVGSEVTVAVNNAIVGAGIEIPFPQRDLHVRSISPSASGKLDLAPEQAPDRQEQES
jgi:small-conductance mechanosensitive channel